jgi:TfoX/Sxy family transcriptional regulator of competence genes
VLIDRVRAALAGTPRVEEKKMFGGTAFMVRGKMCINVGKGRLMCRIDPELHDEALKRAGVSTVVMRGRPYRGFVHVSEAAVKTAAQLRHWIDLALDYNERAKASRR